MKRKLLVAYQLLTGLSDTSTGLLLITAPILTLRLMRLHVPAPDALVYLSYIGTFVLSVGVACLYGARLAWGAESLQKLEVVWLLTAITRGVVALFVMVRVFEGSLESGWMTVAFSDGALAVLQAVGLARGWLNHVEK